MAGDRAKQVGLRMDPRGTAPPLLVLDGLTRSFPGVKAVDDVALTVAAGEIHALLGENGAGKSTLVKIIYGVLQADQGQMTFDGKSYQPVSPAAARARGVGMVFQHFAVFEALTVAENVALGLPGQLPDAKLRRQIVDVSHTYGLDIDPVRVVGTLSAGERQRIEIVRCLLQDPRLIIMDEPTSVLTPNEAARLFVTLRQLAAEGRAILYISHKLEEIRALCSRATILRGGRRMAECDPRLTTAKELAEMMLGATLAPPVRADRLAGPIRISVKAVSCPATEAFGTALHDIAFDVRGGEILGIAGIAGNGQGELMDVLIGERTTGRADAVQVDGVDVGHLGPIQRRKMGMAFVPEERLGHGAVPGMSLTENMLLADTRGGLLNWPAVLIAAQDAITRFDVRTAGPDRAARSLSGGNLQKFIMGRELSLAPKVFIAAQPTWGVDAGAATLIHREIVSLAGQGAAVVLISQDLDELFALAHRIAVIAGGRLSAARAVETLTTERIGRDMAGRDLAADQSSVRDPKAAAHV
jgi:general nucleoside transport system ATP-binding protein